MAAGRIESCSSPSSPDRGATRQPPSAATPPIWSRQPHPTDSPSGIPGAPHSASSSLKSPRPSPASRLPQLDLGRRNLDTSHSPMVNIPCSMQALSSIFLCIVLQIHQSLNNILVTSIWLPDKVVTKAELLSIPAHWPVYG